MTVADDKRQKGTARGELGARVQKLLTHEDHSRDRIVIGVIVFLAALMAFAAFIFLPEIKRAYYHLNPKPGFIFVESPEVYTRERLINERLSEDAWLHNELGRADAISLFPASSISRSSSGLEARTGTGKKPAKPKQEENKDAGQQLSAKTAQDSIKPALLASQQFRLRSAARSLIRQRIIENNLDDRHDLADNTLYVLKFDTTVMASPATGRKAMVVIRIRPPINYEPKGGKPPEASSREAEGQLFDKAPTDHDVAELELDAVEWISTEFKEWIRHLNTRISNLAAEYKLDRQRQFDRTAPIERIREPRVTVNADASEYYRPRFDIAPETQKVLDSRAGEHMAIKLLGVVDALADELEVKDDEFIISSSRTVQQICDALISTKPTYLNMSWNLDPEGLGRLVSTTITVKFPAAYCSQYAKKGFKVEESDYMDIHQYARETLVFAASPGCFAEESASKFFASGSLSGEAFGLAENETLNILTPTDIDARLQHDHDTAFWGGALLSWYLEQKTNEQAEANKASQDKAWQDDATGKFGNVADLTQILKSTNELFGYKFSPGNCKRFYTISINTGLIQFIKQMLRYRSYSYSVLPRDNAVVSLNEASRAGLLEFGKFAGASATLRSDTQHNTIELRPTLMTFGETVSRRWDEKRGRWDGEKESPVVGWIMDPAAAFPQASYTGDLVTIGESTLAIVSVPSWWRWLKLDVTRRWIDKGGDAQEAQDESQNALNSSLRRSFSIPLPHNPQVLDSVLLLGFPKEPKIDDVDSGTGGNWEDWNNLCDADLLASVGEVLSDQPAGKKPLKSVLVSGKRLWRNTVVTLGSQRAREIELLPNMKGLIAKFDCSTKVYKDMKLRAWTSLGVDDWSIPLQLSGPSR